MEDANKKRKSEQTSGNDSKILEENFDDEFDYIYELSISDLRDMLKERNIDYSNILEKDELLKVVKDQLKKEREEGIFKKKKTIARRDCPYLDTIKRELLDFDFEKVCSVTSQNLNVYACLVCGKFFQGRGRSSQAYLHSLQANHHVFINLHNEKVYCLPDDYEVVDPSLSDIKYVLNPTFTAEQIAKLDQNKKKALALIEDREYLPGFVGLNNIKQTDWFNVIVQSFMRVIPFRNFFMFETNYSSLTKDPLVFRFGELLRKMENPRNFKAHVDPHELLQAVSSASQKKFQIGQHSDPIEFLGWFLNTLHKSLSSGAAKNSGPSIVHKVFQGQVEITTEPKVGTSDPPKVEKSPFLFLTLDVPPPPLFKDEMERNIIPQRPIFDLLSKFDGKTVKHFPVTGERKTFRLLRLPRYLIVGIKRFTKNNWFKEKNPTIITSPLKNLDLRDYMAPDSKYQGSTRYDLVANIVHEGEPNAGSYKVHVLNKASEQWYEMHDLLVKETLPQLIAISESYIQIFERNDSAVGSSNVSVATTTAVKNGTNGK